MLLAPLGVVHAQAPNSPKDPYNIDVDRRVTAGTPVPYGVILDARVPYVFSKSSDPSPGITAGADFYYDAWQVGAHLTDYGFVGRLGSRSVGRDWWGGWFVEVGSGQAGSSDTSYSSFLIGGGYHNTWLFGRGVMYGPDLTFAAGSDAGNGSGITAGRGWNSSYVYFALGLMIRIPIGTSSLLLDPCFFAGSRPRVYLDLSEPTYPSLNAPSNGYSGVGLNVSWGFNFE